MTDSEPRRGHPAACWRRGTHAAGHPRPATGIIDLSVDTVVNRGMAQAYPTFAALPTVAEPTAPRSGDNLLHPLVPPLRLVR